ncbi:MAG: DUF3878 family protein [Lachnospiraceae bacterium]
MDELKEVLPGLSKESPGEFFLLAELLARDLFELLPPKKEGDPWRITYLMSDAAECFLIPEDPVLAGSGNLVWEEEMDVSFTRAGARNALILRQEDQVATLFFSGLSLEVSCCDYGDIGHFWLPGDELLRLVQFKAEIVNDKLCYLGEAYCTKLEKKLALLYGFPPLSYLFFPAAPKKYLRQREHPYVPVKGAAQAAADFAREAGEKTLAKRILRYGDHPGRLSAYFLARTFRRRSHLAFQETLIARFAEAGHAFPERPFPNRIQAALEECRRQACEAEKAQGGFVFVEVPYLAAQDEITAPRAALVVPRAKGLHSAFRVFWFDAKDKT